MNNESLNFQIKMKKITAFFVIIVNFRTAQEEMRTYKQSHNVSNEMDTNSHKESTSILSTDICMYVHGILVVSLFLIAITRY